MSVFFKVARTAIKMGAILASITAVWLPAAPALAEAESEAYDLRGKEIERLYEDHTEQLQTAFKSLRLIVEAETPNLLLDHALDKPMFLL